MQSKPAAGAVAGLLAGVVFGMMMQMMTAPTPDGGEMPMMMMVAQVVGSDSLIVGWLYHLFNSAVIGGLFGVALGARAQSYRTGLGLGAAWGVVVGPRRSDSHAALPRDAGVCGIAHAPHASRRHGQPGRSYHLRAHLGAAFVRLHARSEQYSAADARSA